ncbi:MAG: hypothetical protein A2Y03_02365 [Omnitrophica WOR_2 bacterium GWF2_38_59]|nr:MAG: hypothetical protein A2Y03_02365 [Omnitrophica WOR_2 bacterium GWF2_38_59]OGX47817.1 MAG: hypothetical protein A2243_00780 [Omnitrophica WOR_2 bacterium RIFOXYA2_FULL_38_17]OGX52909.1 MAG: hypothetical protein A2267_04210 [Omnitrophica WOR_2 bacterium RIFOXYA12_FULL_38_10]OGX56068.1 MAG: hypothetical protein A2306_00435 [Omnitrophica WOR_2 bacterium RIFOXYB2_FULL_38_16]OGX56972.1 MAG: hypothetical protein A2447_05675 [Omnitrophica WOR_2 bacterium RIFOXYC2_FULL_38_12]HBG60296.1 hypothet
MIIDIKVIPQAKKNLIKQENDVFKVYLTAPAVDGKANKALIEVLSEHFGVKKSAILIKKGLKTRSKTLFISGL